MTPAPEMTTAPPQSIKLDALSENLLDLLQQHDPDVARILADEATRQATTLELIASEISVQ